MGVAGGKPSDKKAAVLLEKLAKEEGIPDAQFNLACYYSQGMGVPVNHAAALKWFTLAASQVCARVRACETESSCARECLIPKIDLECFCLQGLIAFVHHASALQ